MNHEEHEEKKDAGSKIINTNDTKKDERRTFTLLNCLMGNVLYLCTANIKGWPSLHRSY